MPTIKPRRAHTVVDPTTPQVHGHSTSPPPQHAPPCGSPAARHIARQAVASQWAHECACQVPGDLPIDAVHRASRSQEVALRDPLDEEALAGGTVRGVLRSGQSGTGIDIQTKTREVPVGDADPRRVGITYGMTPVRPFGVRWRGEDGAPRRPRASTPAERSRSCPSHALLKRTEPALPELSSRAKTLY